VQSGEKEDGLIIIWSSGDREVALNMVFMYAKNSRLNGWWDNVLVVVWGPSAKLLAEDEGLQAELQEMKKAGVEVHACKACADRYSASEKLKSLGIDVIYMGQPLTRYLKDGRHILTF
jgi:hypothetical protein